MQAESTETKEEADLAHEETTEQQAKRRVLERTIQRSQEQIADTLHKYKIDNPAIRHLAVYSLFGTLLAYSPDEEVQNMKLLLAQYDWISRIFAPAMQAVHQGIGEFVRFGKKRVPKDFGRPNVIRLQTEEGDAVRNIYATPIDAKALIFVVATTRAATRRNAFVVNEELLFQDLEALVQELSELTASSQ